MKLLSLLAFFLYLAKLSLVERVAVGVGNVAYRRVLLLTGDSRSWR